MASLSTQCALRLEPGVHHLGGGGQVQAGGEEQQQLASSQKLHFGRILFDVNPPYNQPCHRQGGTFSTLVCSALLPLGYKVNPDLVVLRCFLLISQSFPSFCISQSFVLGHFKLDLHDFEQKNVSLIRISILKQAGWFICHLQRRRKLLGGQMILNNSQNTQQYQHLNLHIQFEI